jgi:hypothetical protein
MSDNQPEPNYQDILDKYAASLKSTEVPPIPEPELKPENIETSEPPKTPKIEENPIISPELTVPSRTEFSLEIKPESELLAPPEPQPQLESVPPEIVPVPTPESIIPPTPPVELPPESPLVSPEPTGEGGLTPRENNFFKYLFFFSLFIFLIVLVSVVISFINSQKSLSNTQNTPTIASSPTVVPSTVCQINDQTYQIGQTFAATDGCNTCTCNSDLTVSCTSNTCTATPSVKLTPTKSATTSAIPATWRTYTNKTYGYSFQYPSISKIKVTNYTGYLSSIEISNLVPNTNYELIDLYIGGDVCFGAGKNPFVLDINGLKVTRSIYPMGQNPATEFACFQHQNNNYSFNLTWGEGTDKNLLNIYNQILSTFKFLN